MQMGAIELEGMDESGELIFSITEKAKEIAPELWEAHQKYVDESLMRLYESGYINITYNENLEALIEVTEEGRKMAREMGLIEMDFPDQEIPND